MATNSCGRSRRYALLLATTTFATGLASPAFAQTATPEQYRNNDEFGVDLTTGTYNPRLVEGNIGSGVDGIQLVRFGGQSGWRDNWSGDLRRTSPGGVDTVTITFGDRSEVFKLISGTWTPSKANGATLTISGDTYIYRNADGTTMTYSRVLSLIESNSIAPTIDMPSNYCSSTNANDCAVATVMTDPDGRKYTLTWNVTEHCTYDSELNATCGVTYRMTDVRSKAAYAMKLKYGTNTAFTNLGGGNQGPPATAWFQRSAAKFYDLSQVYCDPIAFDCDSVTAAAAVSYSYPSTNVINVTDENGGTWVLTTNSSAQVTAIRRPGNSSDTTSVTYGSNGRVSQITDNGETTTYNWTLGTNTTVATLSGAGESDSVTSTPAAAQPTSATNGTSNTTAITYDSDGRKTREARPEGDYTNWTYDARGNITETRIVAKSGSGISDIVATANFDSSCTNPAKCNELNYAVDARGNRTDYTYDSAHGGVTRVQLPAASSGGTRTQIDYTYSALYPQSKDASGTLVNASDPEYKVTQVTACATAATCSGNVNETKIIYAYATPNLQVTSMTVASGDATLSATTAYTYDAADNLKTVDGPLSGSADTTTYF